MTWHNDATLRFKILGNENRIPITVNGHDCHAVRENGCWRIEPAEHAITQRNSWQHLRDLRQCVRRANEGG